MAEHTGTCFGYHDITISCEEATAIRAREEQGLFYCPNSDNHKHAFSSGATSCDKGCGIYLQQLMPDENIGDDIE